MQFEKKSIKQFFWLFATGLITYFIMNTANAYLVNTLGKEAYGDFSLTIQLIFSLTPFFSLGVTYLVTKYLPIYLKDKSSLRTSVFLKWNTNTLKKSFTLIVIIIITTVFLRATHLDESIYKHIPCLINKCVYYRHFALDLLFIIPIALLLIWNSSLLNATGNSLSADVFGTGSITYICAFVIFVFEIFLENLAHNQVLIANIVMNL